MGSKQSTETKNEIVNDTNFRNAVRKSNQLINDITSELVQKNLMSTSSTAATKQELEISNLQAKGDITISNVSQKAKISINVSALSDTDLKQELAQEVTNELRDKIKNLSEASQKQLEDQGEQIFSEVVGALSKSLTSLGQSATGGSSKDKTTTSLKNIIGVDNDTDLENIVNESVSTNVMNETVNEISNAIVGEQSIKFKNIRSKEGKIVISDISQDILTEQIQSSIQKSGLSDAVIAKFSGISQTEIENINKSTQDQTKTEQGTIDATFGGLSSLVGTSMIPFIVIGVVVVVVGIIALFIFFSMTGGGSSNTSGNSSNNNNNDNNGSSTNDNGGGNNDNDNKSKMGEIASKLKENSSNTTLIVGGLIILIIIIVVIIVVYYSTKSSGTESFDNLKNLKKLGININGKWLNQKNPPTFVNSKQLAQKISVTLLDKTYLYISKKSPNNVLLYLKHNKNKNIFEFVLFNVANKNEFKFNYISANNNKNNKNMYYLMQNEGYIKLNPQTHLLNKTPKKTEASIVKFVQL